MHTAPPAPSQVKVLRCIRPPRDVDVVLGQYTGSDSEPGYLQDPTVPPGSRTPTFASLALFVENDRCSGSGCWCSNCCCCSGCCCCLVRGTFEPPPHHHPPPAPLHRPRQVGGCALHPQGRQGAQRAQSGDPHPAAPHPPLYLWGQPGRLAQRGARRGGGEGSGGGGGVQHKRLPHAYPHPQIVVRLQPDEAIYLKMIVKKPGLGMDTAISELDLDYRRRYPGEAVLVAGGARDKGEGGSPGWPSACATPPPPLPPRRRHP